MNINDVELPQSVQPETFKDFFSKNFDIDFEGDGETLTTEYQGKQLTIRGHYVRSAWQFAINGNNFSTRGDLFSLPLERRRQELVGFIRKVVR